MSCSETCYIYRCLIRSNESRTSLQSETIQNANASRPRPCHGQASACITVHKMHNDISTKCDSTALPDVACARLRPRQKYCVHMHNACPTGTKLTHNYRVNLCSRAACRSAANANRPNCPPLPRFPKPIASHFHHFPNFPKEATWKRSQRQPWQQLMLTILQKTPRKKLEKGSATSFSLLLSVSPFRSPFVSSSYSPPTKFVPPISEPLYCQTTVGGISHQT